MSQRNARKKRAKSDSAATADQIPRPTIFGEIGEITDAELPPGVPPEFRQHLLKFHCGLDDGPILDGEVPAAFAFGTIMTFLESYIDCFESQFGLISSCWEMHINRRFALAGNLYKQWLKATSPYVQCLESALDLIVRSNPPAASQVMQLRESFRKGPSLLSGRVTGIAHLRGVVATALTLVSAHKEAVPWGGNFEAVKNESGQIIRRDWRWCKSSRVSADTDNAISKDTGPQRRRRSSRPKKTKCQVKAVVATFSNDDGRWVRSSVAAKLEGTRAGTLASYRHRGHSWNDRQFGIDQYGRIWYRPGTPSSHPWYLKSTLVSEN